MSHKKLPNGYWTDEKVIEESRKYHTRIEFKQNAPTACKLAYQRKLIDKMIWLKTDRHKNVVLVRSRNIRKMLFFQSWSKIIVLL